METPKFSTLTQQFYNLKNTSENEHIQAIIAEILNMDDATTETGLADFQNMVAAHQSDIDALNAEDKAVLEHFINQTAYETKKALHKELTQWDYFKSVAKEKGWDIVKRAIDIIDGNEARKEKINSTPYEITEAEQEILNEQDAADIEEVERLLNEDISDWAKENVSNYYENWIKRSIKKKNKSISNRLERNSSVRFAGWLKEKRKEKKMTLKELADLSGTSASYIQRLENGKRKVPSLAIVQSISEGLGVPYSEILGILNQGKEPIQDIKDVLNMKEFKVKDVEVGEAYKKLLIELIELVGSPNLTMKGMTRITELASEIQEIVSNAESTT